MFSNSKDIVSSDIAVQISYTTSTWFDLVRWLFQRSKKPYCKRAVLALMFCSFVIVIDIDIIFQSSSRSIDVTERDTGITGLSFGADQASAPTPCLRDKIEYEGCIQGSARSLSDISVE